MTGRNAETGDLEFVLPLITRRVSGTVLLEAADLGVSDYAAPVCAAGFQAPAMLARTIRTVLPSHDVLRIKPVREDQVFAWRMFLDAEPRRLDFSAHAAVVGADAAAWKRSSLEPAFASQLDRKKKRFFKLPGAKLRLLHEGVEIAAGIAAIARLRAGRFDGDVIQDAVAREFYAAIAQRGAETGFARTYELELGGETVGATFGLAHRGRFHYLLIGCDYAVHGRHSPGNILYDGMIADWAESGGDTFDFTIGDEPFKALFGCRPTAMWELAAQPSLKGKIARAAFELRTRMRARRSGNQGTGKSDAAVRQQGENKRG